MGIDPFLKPILENELGQRVMRTISNAGGEARYVGGVIRDALAGITIKSNNDLDMAMNLTPYQAMDILQQNGLRVLPTGIDHGTITVFDRRNADQKIELTTLRLDIETDGRHARVAFTEDWQGDAARRDFTMNSLYLDAGGVLYDPFNGRQDLAQGQVKFIGDPAARLAEDYLRMLRFFRFQSRFGKGDPDPAALSAITDAAPKLDRISGERLAMELAKLLPLGMTSGLQALQECGVDHVIVEDGFDLESFKMLAPLSGEFPLAAAYAALISEASLEKLMARLKLSKKLCRQIKFMTMPMENKDLLSTSDWQEAAWQNKPHSAAQADDLAWRYAVRCARSGQMIDTALFKKLLTWHAPQFPVTGSDLIAKGITSGPEMGLVLEKLENHWVASTFSLSRDDLLLLLD